MKTGSDEAKKFFEKIKAELWIYDPNNYKYQIG